MRGERRNLPAGSPGGRLVHYRYGAEGGRDDMISRLATIHDDSGGLPGQVLASYAYSGLGRLAVEEFPQPEVRLDYFQGTSGLYAGLDRGVYPPSFGRGRTKDQRWRFTGQTPADRDRYRYGHDYASNRLWRENALTHGTANELDEAYVKPWPLQSEIRNPKSAIERSWGLDQVGNWPTFKEGDGTNWTLDQTREHNTVNEITDITEGQGQTQWVTPAWDARGNMTSGPKPGAETTEHRYVWDAWNRLAQVKDATNTIIETYRYDGLARRVRKLQGADPENPTTTFDYYYNASWQVLEERKDASAYCQYVWSARYIDAPVLRDRNNDQDPDLEERLYYTTDANMNVTALVGTDGAVHERYTYDPYGKVTFRAADWSEITWANSGKNEILYCGYRFDPETGLYHVRRRPYHPTMGRWVSRDPIWYADGLSLLEYAQSSPAQSIDPDGLHRLQPEIPIPPDGSYGPSYGPREECRCGPDITQELIEVLNRVDVDWMNKQLGLSRRKALCKALYAFPAALGAWDINELYLTGWLKGYQNLFDPPCPTGRQCANTVGVNGRCYEAGEVNYVLFGHIMRLCYELSVDATGPDFLRQAVLGILPPLQTIQPWGGPAEPDYDPTRHTRMYMISMILIRKTVILSRHTTGALAWAEAGYDGWPNVGAPVGGDIAACEQCPHSHHGTLNYTWQTRTWREVLEGMGKKFVKNTRKTFGPFWK